MRKGIVDGAKGVSMYMANGRETHPLVATRRSQPTLPKMKKRLVNERTARHDKRRRVDNGNARSVRRDTASAVLNMC